MFGKRAGETGRKLQPFGVVANCDNLGLPLGGQLEHEIMGKSPVGRAQGLEGVEGHGVNWFVCRRPQGTCARKSAPTESPR